MGKPDSQLRQQAADFYFSIASIEFLLPLNTKMGVNFDD